MIGCVTEGPAAVVAGCEVAIWLIADAEAVLDGEAEIDATDEDSTTAVDVLRTEDAVEISCEAVLPGREADEEIAGVEETTSLLVVAAKTKGNNESQRDLIVTYAKRRTKSQDKFFD